MIPLGDAPNPRGTPFVTYALVAVNVAVYVFITLPLQAAAPHPGDPVLPEYLRVISNNTRGLPASVLARSVSAYDLFVFTHGFRAAAPSVLTVFYSMFLHANFAHLFGNMLFLWIYGDNVESRLGPMRYLLGYLGGGLGAVLFYSLFASSAQLPLIGASGAISGILGFYFVWFPGNQVRLLIMFPFYRVVMVPARIVLGMYLVLDNLLPFLLGTRSGGGVAYGAHIGGFIVGLAGAKIVDVRDAQRARREVDRW